MAMFILGFEEFKKGVKFYDLISIIGSLRSGHHSNCLLSSLVWVMDGKYYTKSTTVDISVYPRLDVLT